MEAGTEEGEEEERTASVEEKPKGPGCQEILWRKLKFRRGKEETKAEVSFKEGKFDSHRLMLTLHRPIYGAAIRIHILHI